MNRKLSLMALGVAVALGGCSTSGNTGVPPTQRTADLSQNKLQFAVGTANIAGTLGLNTVVTYRQPNGRDGTLLNTPKITGPFTNPGTVAQAGADAGTNTISGSAQPLVGTAATPSTFGSSGGAFGYGFQPDNSTTGGGVSFTRYALPIYAAGTTSPFTTITPNSATVPPVAIPYLGGPPAYPNVRDATFPAGFVGYPMGFTDFRLAPAAGTYTLALQVPTGFDATGTATSTTVSAAGTLASLTPLPTFASPTFTPASSGTPATFTGGGTIAVTVPVGVTEAMVILQNRDGSCYPGSNGAPAYFTFLTRTTGAQVITVPPNLGPTFGPQTSTKTLCTGDNYRLYAVGFDYPAFESGPPNNTSPTPAISGANGQADVTTSAIGIGKAPAT